LSVKATGGGNGISNHLSDVILNSTAHYRHLNHHTAYQKPWQPKVRCSESMHIINAPNWRNLQVIHRWKKEKLCCTVRPSKNTRHSMTGN